MKKTTYTLIVLAILHQVESATSYFENRHTYFISLVKIRPKVLCCTITFKLRNSANINYSYTHTTLKLCDWFELVL